MNLKILKELQQINLNVRIDEMLSSHTTLNIGGPAKFFVNITSNLQLTSLLEIIKKYNLPCLIIGAGSNLLISDEGFDGVVIKLREEFRQLKVVKEENKIYAGAGVMLPMLIKTAVDNSMSGMEELFGIPGTVGGAIIMNAGTKTATISDNLDYVEVMNIDEPNLGIIKLKKNEIKFGYRKSGLEKFVILNATFNFIQGDKEKLQKRITDVLITRSQTQPLGSFNAGCVFKNPEKKNTTAAALIDKCGLKGYSYGGATVSDKHANFIINKNNATSKDFIKVMKHVIATVKKKCKIKLEPEIKLVNVKI